MSVKEFQIKVDGKTYASDAIEAQLPQPHCHRPWAGVPVLTGDLPGILPEGNYVVKSFSQAYGHCYKNSIVVEKVDG